MSYKQQLEWTEPLELAYFLSQREDTMVFLHSSLQLDYSGRYSILAYGNQNMLKAESWCELESFLNESEGEDTPLDAFYGYLSYELVSDLEKLVLPKKNGLDYPKLWMQKFQNCVVWDHYDKQCYWYSRVRKQCPLVSARISSYTSPDVTTIQSNMSKSEYVHYVKDILKLIGRGDLYQANLTRKFFGTIGKYDAFRLFCELSKNSPSPYSSFCRMSGTSILSSSPERFLQLNNNILSSRPIKGSAPRYSDSKKDAESKNDLRVSAKDQAENLMIVDLMRHDLARSCKPGSVSVSDMFHVESFQTVHHMSSSVSGDILPTIPPLTAIKHAFPPGSMTGAPKLQAIKVCAQYEQLQRGIYGGAIGYISGRAQFDLSVVIRTLLLQENTFEFQVGGAIVADSEPEKEWSETLVKARGIASVLGLVPEQDLNF